MPIPRLPKSCRASTVSVIWLRLRKSGDWQLGVVTVALKILPPTAGNFRASLRRQLMPVGLVVGMSRAILFDRRFHGSKISQCEPLVQRLRLAQRVADQIFVA